MIHFLPTLFLSATVLTAPVCPAVVRELQVRTTAGHVIAARLSLPSGTAHAPVLVMISGAGPQDRDYSTSVPDGPFANRFFADIESRLHCASIGAVRFDEVGTGRSTGSYAASATTLTLAEDVIALVDALARQRGVDAARIALLGHSEGGAIAGIVAAKRPTIAAVALLSAPVQRGDDIMRFQIGLEERSSAAAGAAARREHAERRARDRWYQVFLRFSPAAHFAQLRQPLLVLHGELDTQVTPVQADSILRLARAAGNRFVYCRRYPDQEHGFYGDDPKPFAPAPAVLQDITRFARLALIARQPPNSPGNTCRQEPGGEFAASPLAPPRGGVARR